MYVSFLLLKNKYVIGGLETITIERGNHRIPDLFFSFQTSIETFLSLSGFVAVEGSITIISSEAVVDGGG